MNTSVQDAVSLIQCVLLGRILNCCTVKSRLETCAGPERFCLTRIAHFLQRRAPPCHCSNAACHHRTLHAYCDREKFRLTGEREDREREGNWMVPVEEHCARD